MMIANWKRNEPVKSQVVSNRLFTFPTPNEIKSVGAIRRVMPSSATVRSRKGMKGGEF
jgi:hypothetical protein